MRLCRHKRLHDEGGRTGHGIPLEGKFNLGRMVSIDGRSGGGASSEDYRQSEKGDAAKDKGEPVSNGATIGDAGVGDEGGGGTEVWEMGLTEGDAADGLVIGGPHGGVARDGRRKGDIFGLVVTFLLHVGYVTAATAFTMSCGAVRRGGLSGG